MLYAVFSDYNNHDMKKKYDYPDIPYGAKIDGHRATILEIAHDEVLLDERMIHWIYKCCIPRVHHLAKISINGEVLV